ncbi:hypothetical protein BD309DRAFT_994233 [Dichomitus squalens]|uniref:Uncharacterized protein n=1 Tax=Dichomitus squalens (strain LYAD-421) TaxID=732165 RepID=R7SPZ2_DICSQ|nr:uncharacterized protein DICSQDRAFT_139974 [Dichomitus squalens LYAD-421 SS1]EJF57810.1 hypothetical protein DICSQDRAFT_139974 [Dichomitus squalens LYAD-421 SS1]TBU38771.1 hypothetical protein BD309DRAFT_994233 [Dichomitus squalens]
MWSSGAAAGCVSSGLCRTCAAGTYASATNISERIGHAWRRVTRVYADRASARPALFWRRYGTAVSRF